MLALLMNGSVAAPYRQIAFLLLSVSALLSVFVQVTQYRARVLLRWVMITICVLTGWAAFQIMPMPFKGLAHPVWNELIDLGLHDRRHISVAPSRTLASLPALVLPFLVFSAILILCQTPQDARFSWVMLAAIGGALAGLSVIMHLLFPTVQFFSDFDIQRGHRFSGIFVNANMTAAMLALVAFAVAGVVFSNPGGQRRSGMQKDPRHGSHISWRQILLSVVLFMLVIFIIMTRSRAGVTFGLGFLTSCLVAYFVLQSGSGKDSAGRLPKSYKVMMAGASGLVVLLFFGEPIFLRMGDTTESLRFCAWQATWQVFLDRPVTGAGFGTFAKTFPQYRDAECLGTSGVWLRAHNSYLEFLAGFGVVAVLVLLVVFVVIGRVLVDGIARRKSMKAIPVFALGAFAYIACHSYFDFPLQMPGIAVYFAALMGSACAVCLVERRSGGKGCSVTLRDTAGGMNTAPPQHRGMSS